MVLYLASLTWHNVFKVHPFCSIPFYGWKILHSIGNTTFCLSIHLADKHLCSFYFLVIMNIAVIRFMYKFLCEHIVNSFWYTPSVELLGHIVILFILLRSHQTVFLSTILYSQNKCTRIPISSHPFQCLLYSIF